MAKPPNYKQDKKRREDAQKKRNAEEQERQTARKKGVPNPTPSESSPLRATGWRKP
jgi:hypothetical protein